MEGRDLSDFTHHIARIGEAHQRLDVHEKRLGSADQRMAVQESRIVAVEKDSAILVERLGTVIDGLREVKSTITWLNRTIIGGIVVAVLAFIISGGLNVGQ